jgi:hypothetical protein
MFLIENSESRFKFMELLSSVENNNKDDQMLKSLVKKNQENLNRRMLSPKFDEYNINKDKLLYINPNLIKKKVSKNLKNAVSENKLRKYSLRNNMENSRKYLTSKNLLERIYENKKNKNRLKRNSVINNNKDMNFDLEMDNKYDEEFKDYLEKSKKKSLIVKK